MAVRKWYHECDVEWLEARRKYITATDIAKLVPAYNRGMKKDPKGLIPEFAALWCEKNTDAEPDPSSVGPAARGHICEPWAVAAWNLQNPDQMCHWDDVIVHRDGVGFSPDALDIKLIADLVEIDADMIHPTSLLEIKSYEPKHHMMSCLKAKEDQDELMQIATAFLICPTLEEANLVFFCPDAPISMKVFEYSRKDLKSEMELAEKIIGKWNDTVSACEALIQGETLEACVHEDEIYEAYLIECIKDESALENVFLLKG